MRKEIYQPSRQSKTEVINKNRAVINSQSLEFELQTTSLQSQKIKECKPRQ